MSKLAQHVLTLALIRAEREAEDLAKRIRQNRWEVENYPILHPPQGWTTLEHFQAAKEWPDAIECLRWACEQGATVTEMQMWRRAIHGDDLVPEGGATNGGSNE